MKKIILSSALSLAILLVTGCPGGNSNTPPPPLVKGTLAVAVPNNFPYNVAETISVELASNNASINGGGLGFSNLTLHTNPSGSLTLLTVSPASTCLAIQKNSTATSCTFIVTNNSSTGENTLHNTGYSVTGQLAGQTVTSNTAYPATIPPAGNYWTININNQSGANQYFFVFGQNLQAAGNPYEVVVFDGSNYGAVHTYSATTSYGSDQNSIILTPGMNTVHIPYGIYGGRAYLSNYQMSGLVLNSNGGIVTPTLVSLGGNNPNYDKIFDNFEFTYAADIVSGVSHAVVNQTQVDALGVPLCIDGTSNYSPITQAGFCNVNRAGLLSTVTTAFNAISDPGLKNQWNSTVLRDGNNHILRIMNPGSADAIAGATPITAFSTYLEPYIADLVAGNQYSANDSLQVSLDGIALIKGKIVPGNPATYNFSCVGGSCNGQSGTMPLTSTNLLTGAPPGNVNNATTLAYEMISSAFMAGQLPPTQQALSAVITQDYLRSLGPVTFYESNSVSNPSEYQYSVFSNALRGVQLNGTYTFPYNDVLGVSSTMTQTLTGPANEPDPITVTVTY